MSTSRAAGCSWDPDACDCSAAHGDTCPCTACTLARAHDGHTEESDRDSQGKMAVAWEQFTAELLAMPETEDQSC